MGEEITTIKEPEVNAEQNAEEQNGEYQFKNKDTDHTFRKNEHILYMDSEDDILTMAKNVGFIVQGKIDMIKSGYEYNYLYILEKPQ